MTGPTRLEARALVRRALRGEAARALPHLLVRSPGGEERVVALPAELSVGRGPEAGLVLADEGASRLHARIRLGEDGVAAVEDLGSKNGLVLNGRRLSGGRALLRAGDELQVGATVLRFEDPLAERSAAPGQAPAGPLVAPSRAAGLLAGAASLLALASILLALA